MDLELDGQRILVTGGGRGLGGQIALGLADEGARVVIAGRSRARLEEFAARRPGRLLPETADLADPGAATGLVARAIDRLGGLDVLVNNAGIAPAGEFATQDPEVWGRTLAVNVLAPMRLAQAAGRHFIERSGGRIVNVASTTGLRGKPGLVGYSASKGAVLRMTEALAAEWARHGIRVNAIAPGAFATEAQQEVLDDPALLERRVRRIPLRRMGDGLEVVATACLLASPVSSFTTGAVFVVDGGEAGKL